MKHFLAAAALLSLAIVLTGCLADQRREIAGCSINARHTYPQTDDRMLSIRNDYIRECMEAAGYEFDLASEAKNGLCWGGTYAAVNPYCYRPSGLFGRLVLKVELSVGRLWSAFGEYLNRPYQASLPPTSLVAAITPSGAQVSLRDITAKLSQAELSAIGDRVRVWWVPDASVSEMEKMQVMVTATLDPRDGTARIVELAEQDRARVASDPRLGTFFERVRRAILDPRCGKELVIQDKFPATGEPNELTFVFRP